MWYMFDGKEAERGRKSLQRLRDNSLTHSLMRLGFLTVSVSASSVLAALIPQRPLSRSRCSPPTASRHFARVLLHSVPVTHFSSFIHLVCSSLSARHNGSIDREIPNRRCIRSDASVADWSISFLLDLLVL